MQQTRFFTYLIAFFTAAVLSLGLGACVVDADDGVNSTTSSSETGTTTTSGDTVVATATGSAFSASNTISINLTDKQVSVDNISWNAITSEERSFFDDTVLVSFTDASVLKIDATGITEKLAIHLSGTQTAGSVKIQTSTDYEMGVYLDTVSITSTDYPCLDMTKGGAVSLGISGTNTLTDGRDYNSDYTVYSDNKGTLYCKGGLALFDTEGSNGTATLNITQHYKSCIATKANFSIESGAYTLASTAVAVYDSTTADYNSPACINVDGNMVVRGGAVTGTASGNGSKGVKVDGTYTQSDGTVDVEASGSNIGSTSSNKPGNSSSNSASASAKGVKVTGAISVTGGKLYAKSTNHEAIESKSTITISGGEVYGYSTGDDGINAASTFTIEGGYVCGYSSANDGLDANGNMYIKGGVVYAVCAKSPEVALDANTEDGYKLYISGGTIMTLGPLEGGASLMQNCYKTSSWSANTTYALTVGDTVYTFKTPASTTGYGSGIVVSGASTPTLTSGATAGGATYFDDWVSVGGTAGSTDISLSSYSTGSQTGGGSQFGGNTGNQGQGAQTPGKK